MELFVLLTEFKSFPANTILLKGDTSEDEGTEFFDITQEMKNDDIFSVYNVPETILRQVTDEERLTVERFFAQKEQDRKNGIFR